MEKIKIFVADDSVVARSMLIRLISGQSNVEVVGEAGSGEGSIILLDEADPDIVLLEASISGSMRLVDIIKELKAIKPGIRVIICTDPGGLDGKQLAEATDAGADDFISKPYKQAIVLRTIRDVAALASEDE